MTEREKLKAMFEEQQTVLNTLNSDYDMACTVDARNMEVHILYVEDWLKELLHDRVEDIVVSPEARLEILKDIVHPDDFKDFCAASMHPEVVKNLTKKGEYNVNYRGYRNGELVYYQNRYLVDKKNPYRIILGIRCIDSHVRAELEKSEMEFLNDIAEYMPGGFFVCKADAPGELIAFNSYMMKLLECSSKKEFIELTHNSYKGMTHPDDYDNMLETVQKQFDISVEKMAHVINRIICRDGSIKWIDGYGHFVHSHNYGDICYVFVNDYTQTFNMAQIERQAEALLGEQIKIKRLTGDSTGDVPAEGTLKGTEVLLVDDNELAREISKDLLEAEGANVTEVCDGTQAIDTVNSRRQFDVILMDIIMPGIDGMETTRQIRDAEFKMNRYTPIICLTADNSAERTEDCIRAGANDCLSKPLVISDLSRTLIRCMREHSTEIEKKLADTIRIANTDTLTHVKNIAAYTDKVSELSREIADNRDASFGVVMCDINDLKVENDTYGHESGNYYIQNSCKLICEIFARSPVYRIGGDEFAVILQGNDYKNAIGLMKQLQERSSIASGIKDSLHGKASVSAGLAIYDPDEDSSVSDVIKRADEAMYEAKRAYKEALRDESN